MIQKRFFQLFWILLMQYESASFFKELTLNTSKNSTPIGSFAFEMNLFTLLHQIETSVSPSPWKSRHAYLLANSPLSSVLRLVFQYFQ